MKKKVLEETLIERYKPSYRDGLTTEQCNSRISQGLLNYTKKKYSKSYFSILKDNLFSFFNLLGLIVLISLILIRAQLSNFFFVLIYVANIFIGIVQEIRAKISIDRLSLVACKNITVIRNGEEKQIPSTQIVLDDVIKLSIGSQVPTDCTILEGEVEVNESLLTGESVAVKKIVGDELLSGSFIIAGTVYVQAVKVGKDNYVEQLANKAKRYKRPYSGIMGALNLIIKIIGGIILPITVAWILKSALSSRDWIDIISKTSTLVIGMIPSGMFLLTSMALAVGVVKLARNNTLVQDLYSLETLARVDTLCFDKTGTITDGRMTVQNVILLQPNLDFSVNEIIGSMLFSLKDNNQTSVALSNYFGQSNTLKAVNILPFNSNRKLSAVSFYNHGTYSLGSPEFILDKNEYSKIEKTIVKYASSGFRVILLAHSNKEIVKDNLPNGFSPIAIILITDNIRENIVETIQWFKNNDVNIKVISGDNAITASEISKSVGIPNSDKFISLEGLSDNEVISIANEYTVFGRVSPEQKALILKSLKAAGHTTAMTGDGVNDILALKEADCAITVASGSDATRNISNLVLTDNNFNSMPKVVFEGRRVINNIQRSASLYLMKTLFTMLLAIITLCMPTIPVYPFVLSQMILLEVFVIGIPSFFLSLQTNDSRVKGKFFGEVIKNSIPSALLMLVNVVIIKVTESLIGYNEIATPDMYSTMSVIVFTMAGCIRLFFICKPFDIYRALLYLFNTLAVIVILLFAVFNGSSLLHLTKMMPLEYYWEYLLIVVSVLLLDFPLSLIIEKITSKIKFKKFKIKKLENI